MKRSRLLRYALLALGAGALAFGVGVVIPLDDIALPAADGRPLLIEDVGIVDLRSGAVRTGQTIVVAGRRIVYAGEADAAPLPENPVRIAGKGKYAIPGLWDMHVHTIGLSPQLHFPLLIANGVTSVRDMGDGCAFSGKLDCMSPAVHWTARAEAGGLLAPRFVATASYHVEESEDGIVAALKARGDRMLKLQLARDAEPALFIALARQAREAGMLVAGHLPYTVDLLDAKLPGMHSIEHDESLLPQCSPPGSAYDGRNRSKLALLNAADEARCDAVLKAMVAQGSGYVPTHIASSYQDVVLPLGHYRSDARVRYVPFPQRLLWRAYASMAAAGTGEDERAPLDAWYKASLALTARAHAGGVAVMAGSDSIDAYVGHGTGLHDELAQLVKAGLTPAQALRAATSVPARHMGMERDFGSIEAGKMADIVILNRNPLDNIANAAAIDSVIYDGRLHQRRSLDAMLSFVERQASSFALSCKFVWALVGPG